MDRPKLEKVTKRGAKKYRYEMECFLHHNKIELTTLDQAYDVFGSLELSESDKDYTFGKWCDFLVELGYKII